MQTNIKMEAHFSILSSPMTYLDTFMLQSRVFTLRHLTDDNCINVLMSTLDTRQGFDVHNVCIKIKGAPKLHVQSLQLTNI